MNGANGLCKVQARIPNGMKPGQTFTVQYTPMAAPAPGRAGSWCGNLIRMRLLARSVGVERVWHYLPPPELHNFDIYIYTYLYYTHIYTLEVQGPTL